MSVNSLVGWGRPEPQKFVDVKGDERIDRSERTISREETREEKEGTRLSKRNKNERNRTSFSESMFVRISHLTPTLSLKNYIYKICTYSWKIVICEKIVIFEWNFLAESLEGETNFDLSLIRLVVFFFFQTSTWLLVFKLCSNWKKNSDKIFMLLKTLLDRYK